MYKISKILNIFFKYVLYVSMFFIWIYYYNRQLVFSFVLSIILSVICDFIISIFVKKRNTNAIIKNEEKKKILDFSNQFLFSTTFQNINFFCDLFKNPNTKKFKNYFIINNTTFLPYYTKIELDENDITNIYKSINVKTKNLVVMCKNCTNTGINLSKSVDNFNFVVLNENDVYFKFLKPLNATIPQNINFKKNKKLKFKELLCIALNKHTAKGYFFSAFIILISSLFIKYKIYYIVFAFMLFILCYFSYFNVWFNKESNNDFIWLQNIKTSSFYIFLKFYKIETYLKNNFIII